MRFLALLLVLIIVLQVDAQCGTCPGGRCAPAPQLLPGRGPCSCLCSCGCNDLHDCWCNGPPAAKKAAADPAPVERGPHCKKGCDCGCAKEGAPCDCKLPPAAENHGVNLEELRGNCFRKHGAIYWLNGKEVPWHEAYEAVGASLPDDAELQRLVIIGSEAERKQVLKDVVEKKLNVGLVVKDYAPTDWAVKEAGFVTTGHPTIYLQSKTGKVLHRQDDYQGGVQALSEALRRADPAYDSSKDPDLRKGKDKDKSKPDPKIQPVADWTPHLVCCGCLTAAAVLAIRRNRS